MKISKQIYQNIWKQCLSLKFRLGVKFSPRPLNKYLRKFYLRIFLRKSSQNVFLLIFETQGAGPPRIWPHVCASNTRGLRRGLRRREKNSTSLFTTLARPARTISAHRTNRIRISPPVCARDLRRASRRHLRISPHWHARFPQRVAPNAHDVRSPCPWKEGI